MKCVVKWAFLGLVLIAFSYVFYKHSGFFQYSHQPFQYMPNMHRTPALKPQRGYAFFDDFSSSRVPPAGSVAREQNPYKYDKTVLADQVERSSNPLPISRDVVLRGAVVFNNSCSVCHGADGAGNGSVVPPFTNPPSLLADKIRNFADSQIFHVITVGQNVMGAYGPQVREMDRWAAIHYIRVLQRAANPTDEDLKLFDQVIQESKR